MSKWAGAVLVVLAVSSAAWAGAAPSLYFTAADVGGGLTKYNFFIDCDDGKMLSFSVAATFVCDTNLLDRGMDEPFEDPYIGYPYPRTQTWVISMAGTGTNSMYGDNTPFCHMTSASPISWGGQIGRDGILYEISGVTPEPASLAMLGLGAAALLRRKRA